MGPGCTTGDVDHATQAFGQAVPFGVISTTGVAGLTLSGGHGYLSRQYGLAVDNLSRRTWCWRTGVSSPPRKPTMPDLFWALRGGGGNFGVVTSFLFRTNPVDDGLRRADRVRAFRRRRGDEMVPRQFQPKAPEEFYIFLGLQVVPPGDPFPKEHWSKKMCVLVVSHNGPLAEGEKAVNAMRAALPKPIIDWAQPMPYTVIQTLFDPLLAEGHCNGTGRATSSRNCRTPPSTRISRTRRSFRACFPECTSIRSTARSIGRRRTRPRGVTATRPGRW